MVGGTPAFFSSGIHLSRTRFTAWADGDLAGTEYYKSNNKWGEWSSVDDLATLSKSWAAVWFGLSIVCRLLLQGLWVGVAVIVGACCCGLLPCFGGSWFMRAGAHTTSPPPPPFLQPRAPVA